MVLCFLLVLECMLFMESDCGVDKDENRGIIGAKILMERMVKKEKFERRELEGEAIIAPNPKDENDDRRRNAAVFFANF